VEESLTDYARRAWEVLAPLQRAVLRAGIVPVVVPLHECRERPADVIARIVALRDVAICFAQGLPESDAVVWALAWAFSEAPTSTAETSA